MKPNVERIKKWIDTVGWEGIRLPLLMALDRDATAWEKTNLAALEEKEAALQMQIDEATVEITKVRSDKANLSVANNGEVDAGSEAVTPQA